MTTVVGDRCPRCSSTDLTDLHPISAGCEADQIECDDCGHIWGDGYPAEAAVPLPAGWSDCEDCIGGGETWGRRCVSCHGRGVVET